MTRSRVVLTAAAALAIAAAGAGAGAGLYSSLESPSTTTVVSVADGERVSEDGALTINGIYKRTHQGVVDITVTSSSSGSELYNGSTEQQAEGSGFVYDTDGHIVTNQHVVGEGGSIEVTFWNGEKHSATLLAVDTSTDLAVIKVDAPASLLHPLELADSDSVEVGDGVIAIGSPFGLSGSVTSGIVSALDRSMDSPGRYPISGAIQTDAPINHGNSGGPLIDTLGRVIGVNTQIQSDSGGSDGVGFAIPSNTIRDVANDMIAGKTPQHAYLGVQVGTSSEPEGAVLTLVHSTEPAGKAGLETGDVITKLDDTTISDGDDLSEVIDDKEPGDTLKVTYVRDGETHTVTVTLGTRPS